MLTLHYLFFQLFSEYQNRSALSTLFLLRTGSVEDEDFRKHLAVGGIVDRAGA